MTRLPLFVLPGIFLVAQGLPAVAQESAPPAHVEYVDGRAVLEHDTTSEDVEPNLPLDTGDRLRTMQGRAEVLFGDGSILQLDEETTIDVLSDSLVRELAGRVAVIAGSARAGRLQIDTPAGSVRITSPGEFRVSVFDEGGLPEVEVAVIRGSADLFTDRGTVSIGAGARALARQGDAPSQPMSFNSARWDAFDRWSQERLSLRRSAGSYRYVPPPLRPYGAVLDAYGSWNYEPTYGYVWFPQVVSGWRPYYNGHWRFYGRFGWTWVGGDVWGWPTHHYGRWGTTAAGAWFWVPGATWGPAWVHWAVSPSYVSWCPLGFDGRPVVPFGYGYAARPYYRHDPWNAWTVVRRDHFGGYGPVTRVAVDGRRFGPEGVRPFVEQAAPPTRSYAVSRAAAGANGNGGTARPTDPVQNGGVAVRRRAAEDGSMAGTRGAADSGGRAVSRGSADGAGQSAAAREWGRDFRWNTPPADRTSAIRRGTAEGASVAPVTESPAPSRRPAGVEAVLPREPGQGGHYGSAAPRRAPVTAENAPAPSVPRGSARPWNPASVPVYRGGALGTPPESGREPRSPEGAAGAPRRPGYQGATAPPQYGEPRAVPRGSSEYSPAPPRAVGPAYGPRTYQSRGEQPQPYQPPSAPPPAAGPGAGPRYREAPGRENGPAAPPPGAPRGGGNGPGVAVPRGGGERGGGQPAPASAPQGGHQSHRR